MKKYLLFMVAAYLGGMSSAVAQKKFTTETLLQEMTSFKLASQWPVPAYTMSQASSYDRRSIARDQPGWFANTDQNQFIRKETNQSRTEYVMMDAAGPGAIVRFWLTTLAKPGVLRFYLDKKTAPAIEIPAFDLLKAGMDLGPALLNPHSSYDPAGKGGNTLYFPILYQQHCKVTVEFPDSVSLTKPHYYQINYRTYEAGTSVQTFSREDLTIFRSRINQAEKTLWNPPVPTGKSIQKSYTLQPGEKSRLDLPAGNYAIGQLLISLEQGGKVAEEKAFRNTILNIHFDGKETVRCPLGDFAGSGFGRNKVQSWYRGMNEEGKLASRWLMPYQRTAEITIINEGKEPVDASLSVQVKKEEWTSRSMYFHASYRQEDSVWDAKWDYPPAKLALHDSTAPMEWNLVRIKGKGVYLGNTLAIDNLMKTWYGEGDAKAYVDGASFPVEFGTGLEDYYNTSWAPVVLYQTPFANAPRADNESSFGHNTFTRTRNLDGIPFRTSFVYDLEMISWDGGYVNAAVTVYWYGAPGASLQ